MKRIVLIALSLVFIATVFTSCDSSKNPESDTESTNTKSTSTESTNAESTSTEGTISAEEKYMMDKLREIEKDWTSEQVHEHLGKEPDIPMSDSSFISVESYYLSDTKVAVIYYNSDKVLRVFTSSMNPLTTEVIEDIL